MATTSVWGLNEKGELVAVAGTGSSNIVGFLNEDFVPTDAQGRLVIAGLGKTGKTGVTAIQSIVGGDPGAGTGAGTGVGYLMDVQRTAPFGFSAVRLVFENYDTTAPMQINAAGVAVTAAVTVGTAGDAGKYVSGPAGNTLTWKPVTFNGGSLTASVATAVAGVGSTSNGIHIQPGLLISDVVYIQSVPRADGSPLPFLRTRAHVNDNSFTLAANQAMVTALVTQANTQLTGGHIVLTGQRNNVVVGNALTDTLTPYYYGGNAEPVGVIYYASQPVRNIVAFGDSLVAGAKSTGGYLGWPNRIETKYGISAANKGVSGQRLENTLPRVRNFCAQYKPHYAAIYAWSPNSPPNVGGTSQAAGQAVMDALWAQVLYTIDYLQQLGVQVVVLTSPPVNYNGAADSALVRAQNARVLALPDSIIKVDIAGPLTDPSTVAGNTPQINPAYSGADGTHYNDAGYELIADMVYAAIK